MTTNLSPQCTHEEDVVDSFGSQGETYNGYDLPTSFSIDVDSCIKSATVYTKYEEDYIGGVYSALDETNYITDI